MSPISSTQSFLDCYNRCISKPFIECIEYESCGCITTHIIWVCNIPCKILQCYLGYGRTLNLPVTCWQFAHIFLIFRIRYSSSTGSRYALGIYVEAKEMMPGMVTTIRCCECMRATLPTTPLNGPSVTRTMPPGL